ncbi:junctional adhesion molecule-like [Lemur catta]|uniref:junctional adhesion molecule-like n=1 Tax=Lemur catta TaxID=9447 RepID=UPI001E26C716|nr:junctional adhesion molecule-like [Lemur catta]
MFCPLKLILIPVLLGLNDLTASPSELTVHVGDPALMGCVLQSTEEKQVTKVDWMLSSGEPAQDEYVLYYYADLNVSVGRFQNRAWLVGDISRHDGSLLLQDVQEADQGNYTCEMRLKRESLVFKKIVVLHVLPEEPKEFTVHVGDSTRMGCVFQSTDKKQVTKVDWIFSSGEPAKEEAVLRYHHKLKIPVGSPQNWGNFQNQGRFQNRVNLLGDISQNDGSIVLQGVKESDRGTYTCTIHLGNLVFRKTVVLHVIQEESQTLVTPAALGPVVLGGNHVVIIVGIVCGTILLLPVLILIVKKTHGNKRSVYSTTSLNSLENTKKANPEKHIYTSITTREVIEEEDPSGKSEATYMTMHPVWPSQRSDPKNPPDNKSAGGMPKTEQAF